MRLTALIFFACLMQVSAATFAQRVTLNKRNVPLESVLRDIRSQSGYDFFYDYKVIPASQRVTINVVNATVEEALNNALKGLNLGYKIEDKIVTIKANTLSTADNLTSVLANIDVRGRIVTLDGAALPAAIVRVKQTTKTVQTNDNGEFYLTNVDENAVLVVSFLGYKGREVKVKPDLGDIALELSTQELKEVQVMVSTGYQTLSKERSAGSFAKPEMAIVANRTSSMNILQRLDGLVAGLTVNNSPGATDNPLLVRGVSTVGVLDQFGTPSGTNRNPLFVVDGIPLNDVSSINPQDVADITVLKDATAASIWGARAANGVIVITTKRGKRSDRITVTYDGFVNLQGKPDFNYVPALNSSQFIQAAQEVFDPVIYPWETVTAFPSSGTGVPPHELILYNQNRGLITAAQAQASLDSLAGISNRSQIRDIWYRNAMLTNHTISLSGGGDKYAFYGSGAFTNNMSSRPGEKNNTYKVNLRQDYTVNRFLQLNLITDLTYNTTDEKRNIDVDYGYYPYQLFKDAAGNNISMPYMQSLSEETRALFESQSKINLDYNPLNEYKLGRTNNRNLLTRNVLGVNLKLIKGLRFEGTYGFVRGANREESFDDQESYLVRNELVQFTQAATTPAGLPTYNLPRYGGRLDMSNVTQQNWTLRNQLVYENSWNSGLHQLNILAGQESQEQTSSTIDTRIRGYNPALLTFGSINWALLTSANGIANPVMPNNFGRSNFIGGDDSFERTELITRFSSYYGNAAYTFNQKYSINASIRTDQSNLFGLDKSAQNRPAWSVGGKWMISQEAFMTDVQWVPFLAVRATYGLTGNSPSPGTAASQDVLRAQVSSFVAGLQTLVINTAANRKLTWESTATTNLGLDFGVLNGRITGSLDFYHKKTSDLLGNIPTNSFTGYSTIVGNIGDLDNKGVELNLNTVNITAPAFRWSTVFNIAYNKNKIVRLNATTPVTTGEGRVSQQYVEGYPAFAIFAYRFAGLDALGDPQIKLADGSSTKELNAAAVKDIKFMGTYQPVWSGGITNVFTYKSFTLSAATVLNLGHVMRNDVNRLYSGRLIHGSGNNIFASGNVHPDFLQRWQRAGDEASTSVPSYVANAALSSSRRNTAYYTAGDINVIDASYIKLKDLTLAYSMPGSWVRKLAVQQIALRAQLSNVLLWKANHEGIDPEFQYAYGVRSQRINQGTVSFGLNVRF